MSGSGLLELGAFVEAYSDFVRQTLWIIKKSRVTGNNDELNLRTV